MNKIYEFFGNDSLFGRIFGTLGNMITVNLLFIVCSIPVITFGASFTSMYYALLRNLKYGDSSLFSAVSGKTSGSPPYPGLSR